MTDREAVEALPLTELTLGEQVRHARGPLGLRELARRIGVSPSYLHDIEANRRRPSAKVWDAIAAVIQVESGALIVDRARELWQRDPELARYLAGMPTPEQRAAWLRVDAISSREDD